MCTSNVLLRVSFFTPEFQTLLNKNLEGNGERVRFEDKLLKQYWNNKIYRGYFLHKPLFKKKKCVPITISFVPLCTSVLRPEYPLIRPRIQERVGSLTIHFTGVNVVSSCFEQYSRLIMWEESRSSDFYHSWNPWAKVWCRQIKNYNQGKSGIQTQNCRIYTSLRDVTLHSKLQHLADLATPTPRLCYELSSNWKVYIKETEWWQIINRWHCPWRSLWIMKCWVSFFTLKGWADEVQVRL